MCRMCILPHVGMGHNAHAVGTKPPKNEKLIGTLHCHFPSATLCFLLHLTLGNGSEALNPAGFTVFDKFSQGGADLTRALERV